MQIPTVQNELAKQLTAVLSKQLDCHISIKKVRLNFINRLTLNEVYIEDQNRDSLLFVYDLDLSYALKPLLDNKIRIKSLCLTEANFNLKKSLNSDEINAQFIFDLFESKDTSTTVIDLALNDLEIYNSSFKYRDENSEIKGSEFDVSNINITGLNLILANFTTDGKELEANKINLSLKASKIFEIKQLDAVIKAGPSGIYLSEMDLQTGRSKLQGEFALVTDSWSDFKEFNTDVKFDTELESSTISMKDISFFAPALKGMNESPVLSGHIQGSVSKLRGRDIQLSLKNHTNMSLSFELNGLPDVKETYFYLDIKNLLTSSKSIEQISLPYSAPSRHLELPAQLENIGQLRFNGTVTGYTSDLVANGQFNTDVGEVYTDLLIRQGEVFEYSGYVKTNKLDIGAIVEKKDLIGKISMEANVEGKGLKKNDVELNIDARIAQIDVKKYEYQNVAISGELTGPKFRGKVNIDDENLDLTFIGSIDLSDKEKQLNFMAEIGDFRPYYILGSDQFDSSAVIESTINIDISARDIDSLVGHLDIYETTYNDSNDSLVLEQFSFNSSRKGDQKKITLESDIADFDIEGQFDMLDNFKTADYLLHAYLPNAFPDTIEMSKNFDFNLKIKDFSIVNAIISPDLWVEENTFLTGHYNTEYDDLKIEAQIIGFEGGGVYIDTSNLSLAILDEHLVFDTELLIHNKEKKRRRITWNSNANDNSIYTEIRSRGGGNFATNLNINTVVNGSNSLEFDLKESGFLFGDSIWKFNDDNKIIYDSATFQVNNLKTYKKGQYILIDGAISEKKDDVLSLELSDFNLFVLDRFIREKNIELSGILNGKVSVRDFYNERLIESNLRFDSLGFNEKLIGSGDINSQWNKELSRLEVDGNLVRNDTNTFNIGGYYDTKNVESPLQFDLKLLYLPLVTLEPLTQGILSDFQGYGGAHLSIRGQTKSPVITGKMGILQTKAHIDYLNTSFHFLNSENEMNFIPISFEKDAINIKDFTLMDEYGNKGRAGLKIIHEGFKTFKMGLEVHPKKLLVLNTTSQHNELFYGRVFISGLVKIGLKEGATRLTLDITTEDGTKFNLPIESSTTVTENEFVVFEKSAEMLAAELEEVVEQKKDINIVVNMRIKASPKAEMRLVFDETTGDMLRAKGEGELAINFSKEKGLDIIGEYVIESGDYLFTLEGVVNKRFYIEQGSSIKWNGDPLTAQMDISTSYRLRTQLKNILADVYSDVNYEGMTQIELMLNMDNTIADPLISFDINLPNTPENGRSQMRTMLTSENCLNQQVFSLIIIKSFTQCIDLADDGGNQAQGIGRKTAYETMSNQLSNWLSRISDDVDIGVHYNPEIADEDGQISPETMEVALSTQLFNDRLILDGNVGYGDQTVNTSTRNSDVVGEVTIEYKIRADGRLRVKAFNHVNDRSYIENDNLYVQGVGITYRRDCNRWGELWRETFAKKEKSPEVE